MKKTRFPLITLLLVSSAGLLFLLTRGNPQWSALLYGRAALADGEVWRLVTGHLMHFSWTHLAADTGGFLLLGLLVEKEQGRRTLLRLLLLLSLGTSAALWLFVPQLAFYGGMSALNYGLLTWLCLTERGVMQKPWDWIALLFPVLLLAHIGWQSSTEESLLSAGLPRAVRVAWQAHLAAVVLACIGVAAKESLRTWRDQAPSCAAAP